MDVECGCGPGGAEVVVQVGFERFEEVGAPILGEERVEDSVGDLEQVFPVRGAEEEAVDLPVVLAEYVFGGIETVGEFEQGDGFLVDAREVLRGCERGAHGDAGAQSGEVVPDKSQEAFGGCAGFVACFKGQKDDGMIFIQSGYSGRSSAGREAPGEGEEPGAQRSCGPGVQPTAFQVGVERLVAEDEDPERRAREIQAEVTRPLSRLGLVPESVGEEVGEEVALDPVLRLPGCAFPDGVEGEDHSSLLQRAEGEGPLSSGHERRR